MPVPVSIVIPTWNGRLLLERFLPSVIAAARAHDAPVEIVVVDDGSTDDTVTFLTNLAHTGSVRLRVMGQEQNLGFAEAANHGIREALHPYVWL